MRFLAKSFSNNLGMKVLPMIHFLRRMWIPMVLLIVTGTAGFGVWRLHGQFGATGQELPSYVAGEAETLSPKRLVYEVFGSNGATATINYLDASGQPHEVVSAPLPWSYEITTTLSAVIANIVAQGNSDSIGCRVTVDDVVKAERSDTGVNAATFCLVKSA